MIRKPTPFIGLEFSYMKPPTPKNDQTTNNISNLSTSQNYPYQASNLQNNYHFAAPSSNKNALPPPPPKPIVPDPKQKKAQKTKKVQSSSSSSSASSASRSSSSSSSSKSSQQSNSPSASSSQSSKNSSKHSSSGKSKNNSSSGEESNSPSPAKKIPLPKTEEKPQQKAAPKEETSSSSSSSSSPERPPIIKQEKEKPKPPEPVQKEKKKQPAQKAESSSGSSSDAESQKESEKNKKTVKIKPQENKGQQQQQKDQYKSAERLKEILIEIQSIQRELDNLDANIQRKFPFLKELLLKQRARELEELERLKREAEGIEGGIDKDQGEQRNRSKSKGKSQRSASREVKLEQGPTGHQRDEDDLSRKHNMMANQPPEKTHFSRRNSNLQDSLQQKVETHNATKSRESLKPPSHPSSQRNSNQDVAQNSREENGYNNLSYDASNQNNNNNNNNNREKASNSIGKGNNNSLELNPKSFDKNEENLLFQNEIDEPQNFEFKQIQRNSKFDILDNQNNYNEGNFNINMDDERLKTNGSNSNNMTPRKLPPQTVADLYRRNNQFENTKPNVIDDKFNNNIPKGNISNSNYMPNNIPSYNQTNLNNNQLNTNSNIGNPYSNLINPNNIVNPSNHLISPNNNFNNPNNNYINNFNNNLNNLNNNNNINNNIPYYQTFGSRGNSPHANKNSITPGVFTTNSGNNVTTEPQFQKLQDLEQQFSRKY